jgi:hypothetical protein
MHSVYKIFIRVGRTFLPQRKPIFKEGKAETDPEALATWLYAAAVPIERLGLEAGPLSPWLCEGLRAISR